MAKERSNKLGAFLSENGQNVQKGDLMDAKKSKFETQYEIDMKLLEQHDFRCGYCGLDFLKDPYAFKDIEFDHITPRKHGGGEVDNRIPACHFCNSIKHDKVFRNIDESKEKLKQLRENYLVIWKYYELRKKHRGLE